MNSRLLDKRALGGVKEEERRTRAGTKATNSPALEEEYKDCEHAYINIRI